MSLTNLLRPLYVYELPWLVKDNRAYCRQWRCASFNDVNGGNNDENGHSTTKTSKATWTKSTTTKVGIPTTVKIITNDNVTAPYTTKKMMQIATKMFTIATKATTVQSMTTKSRTGRLQRHHQERQRRTTTIPVQHQQQQRSRRSRRQWSRQRRQERRLNHQRC